MAYKAPGAYAQFNSPSANISSPGETRVMALIGTGQKYYYKYNVPITKSRISAVDKLPDNNIMEIESVSSQMILNNKINKTNIVYTEGTNYTLKNNKYISWTTVSGSTATLSILPGHGDPSFAAMIVAGLNSDVELICDKTYKIEITYVDSINGSYQVTDITTNTIIGEYKISSTPDNDIIPGIGLAVTSTYIAATPPATGSILNVGDYVFIKTEPAQTQAAASVTKKVGFDSYVINYGVTDNFNFDLDINKNIVNAVYKIKFELNGVAKPLSDVFSSFNVEMSGIISGVSKPIVSWDKVAGTSTLLLNYIPTTTNSDMIFGDCSTLPVGSPNYNILSLGDKIHLKINYTTKSTLTTNDEYKLLIGITGMKLPTGANSSGSLDGIDANIATRAKALHLKVWKSSDVTTKLLTDKDQTLSNLIQNVKIVDESHLTDSKYVIKVTDLTPNATKFKIYQVDSGGLQTYIGTYSVSSGPDFVEVIPGIAFTINTEFNTISSITQLGSFASDIKNDENSAVTIEVRTGAASTYSVPAEGDVYYVSYKYAKDKKNFEPKIFYDYEEVEAEYGQYNVTASGIVINSLSLAAEIAFLNGATPIICVQAENDDELSMNTAIDSLNKNIPGVSNISSVIPLTTIKSVAVHLVAFINNTEIMQYKMGYFGSKFNEPIKLEGTGENIGSLQTSTSFNNERMVYIVPGGATKTIKDPNTGISYVRPIPSPFLATAVAAVGVKNDPAEPLTNKQIFGFNDLLTQYSESEMNTLAASGCLVLKQTGLTIKIRHGITTSRENINSSEITLIQIKDFIVVSIKDSLAEVYIGKKLNPTLVSDVTYTLTNMLNQFISQDIILSYNSLSVKRNKLDPRQLDLKFTIEAVYPLNYININFGFTTNADI